MALVRPERRVREIGRILRPGGALGLLWNLRDESERWVAELGEIVRGEDRTSVEGADVPPILEDLGAPIVRRARHTQSLTTGQVLELVGTWSFVSQHVDRSQVLARVEALLTRRERDEGISAHELPYICVADPVCELLARRATTQPEAATIAATERPLSSCRSSRTAGS